jgi:hypothetical protein
MMDTNKAKEWWSNRSPLFKKQLQIKYYPAVNYNFLSQQQIFHIFNHENKNFRH